MPDASHLPVAIDEANRRVAETVREYAHHARGAYATETERALKNDIRAFSLWCRAAGVASLPASPETVVRYIDDQAREKAPATIRRRVASVSKMHIVAGLPNPVTYGDKKGASGDEKYGPVKLALRRMHRERGRGQRQAGAITGDILKKMIAATGDRVIDKRNRALLLLGYDIAARRSEVVSFVVSDLSAGTDGLATIRLRRSKTDQEGEGIELLIGRDTLAALSDWMTSAKITQGPIFRSVNKAGKVGGPLSYRSDPGKAVAAIFREMAVAAGLPADIAASISGHSARVGNTQDKFAAGIELGEIMRDNRWKSPEMPMRYGAKQAARRSGTAKLLAMQGRL